MVDVTRQSLTVEGVTSISVSDVVIDADTGEYVRLLQVYLDPTSSPNRRPVLEVTVRAVLGQYVQIATPTFSF